MIEGVFKASGGYSNLGVSVLKTKTLILGRNGRYSTSSSSGVVATTGWGVGNKGSSSAGEGSYRDFRLLDHPAAGRRTAEPEGFLPVFRQGVLARRRRGRRRIQPDQHRRQDHVPRRRLTGLARVRLCVRICFEGQGGHRHHLMKSNGKHQLKTKSQRAREGWPSRSSSDHSLRVLCRAAALEGSQSAPAAPLIVSSDEPGVLRRSRFRISGYRLAHTLSSCDRDTIRIVGVEKRDGKQRPAFIEVSASSAAGREPHTDEPLGWRVSGCRRHFHLRETTCF